MGKKNLMPEEKGGKKISLSSRNQPSTAESLDRRSIHPPGRQGIACTTHFPLAALCLSLRTALRQQWPLPSRFVLSCSPLLSAFQSS